MTRLAAFAAVLALAACGQAEAPTPHASTPQPALQAQHRANRQEAASAVVGDDERDWLPRRPVVVPRHDSPAAPTPAPRASRGAARTPAPRPVPTGDVWARLARCESGMRNLRNYPYTGYFQFLASTWRSLGYSGVAADFSYETQREGAQRLLARSGRNQWPVCGPRVGL